MDVVERHANTLSRDLYKAEEDNKRLRALLLEMADAQDQHEANEIWANSDWCNRVREELKR